MFINEKNRLKELSEGNPTVINELYSKTFPKVISFVLKNKGTKSDAEDIFQKVLMQLIARYRVKAFDTKTTFEGYIYTAAKNLWRRELNKRKNRVTNDGTIELTNEESDMASAILEQEKWELFQEKMELLSDNCRTVLKLFFKKIPYEEIMIQMNYSSNSVLRQRIFKCKNKLTDLIKNDPQFLKIKNL